MNGYSLGYIYGWALAVFSVSVLPPILLAFAEQEQTTLAGFLVTGLIASFIGGALIIALKGRTLDLNRREKILLIVCVWIVYILLAAIPFEASQALPSRLNAIFESASALTTTGATVLYEVVNQPKSILLWRAQLQWIGGFLTLLTGTYLLVRIWGAERAEREIFKSPTDRADSISHLLATIKLIAPIYVGLSVFFVLGLLFCGFSFFDAVTLVMSTISTGGMLPREGAMMTYGSVGALYILSLTMFFGAISILWSNFLIKQQWSNLKTFKEPFWIGGAILFVAFLILWIKFQFNENREFLTLYREIGSALFDASSLISTTGVGSNSQSLFWLPAPLILVLILIGGGMLSTAGGIKFSRLMLMFRQSRGELRSLIYPHEVRPLYFSKEEKDYKYLSTIWVTFGLAILLLVLLATFLAFYGLGLQAALFTAASVLANCGPCLGQVESAHAIGALPFVEFDQPVKIALIVAMIVGRLEFLVALSLLHISFWRH